jgi:hypothetical protein
MTWYRRWRRRIEQNRRQRLVAEIKRCQGWMAAILTEARAVGAPETTEAALSVAFWRSWSMKVQDWAE